MGLVKGAIAKLDPAQAARVRPIFVSVDPERDTPASLERYLQNLVAKPAGGLAPIGLTGTHAQLHEVIARYGGDYERDPAPPGYLHRDASDVALRDRSGWPAARLRLVERGRRSAGRCAAAGALTMDDPARGGFAEPGGLAAPELAEGQRRRAVAAIFAGAGPSTTGYLMSATVNALIAEALHAAPAVGVPSAVTVLGTAIGSSLLMRGRGRGRQPPRAMLAAISIGHGRGDRGGGRHRRAPVLAVRGYDAGVRRRLRRQPHRALQRRRALSRRAAASSSAGSCGRRRSAR